MSMSKRDPIKENGPLLRNYFSIDQIVGNLTRQSLQQIVCHQMHFHPGSDARASDMRQGDHIGQRKQGVVRGDRFLFEYSSPTAQMVPFFNASYSTSSLTIPLRVRNHVRHLPL